MTKKTQKQPMKTRTPNPPKLQEERKRLRNEINQLKAERDRYKKSLVALLHEDIPINKKELLALVGKQPSLRELLSELESQGG